MVLICFSASDGSLLSPSISMMEEKRRKNPFINEVTSSTLSSTKLNTSDLHRSPSMGSSVFDNLKLLKPEKLRVGPDTKAMPRRKSVLTSLQKQTSSVGEQENKTTSSLTLAGAKNMTPFQIFFEKIKPQLQGEFPEEEANEKLLSVAMKRWKLLSSEEKSLESLSEISSSSADSRRLKRKSESSEQIKENQENATEVVKKKKFDSAVLEQFSFN